MNSNLGVPISTDLSSPQSIPYFLWDEPMTVAEFRERLQIASTAERTRLLAKLLREARDTDVWQFITPAEVWQRWTAVAPQLGRRRAFWEFLFDQWQDEGLAAQIVIEKPVVNGIRLDPPQEILANKLCALLSRSEIRDLVDVRALELAGYRVEDALTAAAKKDRGLTPAQLGWVLSQIELGEDLIPPGGVPTRELRRYLSELIVRLAKQAFPQRMK